MTEIGLKDVRKAYGDVEVIHGIDLDIHSGKFVVFVGPSGCGKSSSSPRTPLSEETT